jgi:serine/threonine protein kinase
MAELGSFAELTQDAPRPTTVYVPDPIRGLTLGQAPLASGPYFDIWTGTLGADAQRVVVKVLVDRETRVPVSGRDVEVTPRGSTLRLAKQRLWKDFAVPQLVHRMASENPERFATYAKHFPRSFGSTAGERDTGDEQVYSILEHGGDEAETLTSFMRRRASILQSMGKLTQMCKTFIRDATEALCFLHALGWVHQDVWSDNFVVRADCSLWLIDFSGAHNLLDEEDIDFHHGSLVARPPERLGDGQRPTVSCAYDLWGLGALVAFIFLRGQLYDLFQDRQMMDASPISGPPSFRDGPSFQSPLPAQRAVVHAHSPAVRQTPERHRKAHEDRGAMMRRFEDHVESPKSDKKRRHRKDRHASAPSAGAEDPEAGALAELLDLFMPRDNVAYLAFHAQLRSSPGRLLAELQDLCRPEERDRDRRAETRFDWERAVELNFPEDMQRFALRCFAIRPEQRTTARDLLRDFFGVEDAPQPRTAAVKAAHQRTSYCSLPGTY